MISALTPHYSIFAPIAQKSVAAASIGATYSLIGTTFGEGVVMLIITSTLDQTVQISLDGTTDFMPILTGKEPVILNLKANHGVLSGVSGVWVKEIGNPTTGSLYISAFGIASR